MPARLFRDNSFNFIWLTFLKKKMEGWDQKKLEKLRTLLKKNVKFVEFDEDIERFVRNLCKPYKVNNIIIEGNDTGSIVKIEVNLRDKSKLIGKGGRNINMIRKLARRHHPIRDVQIV